MTHTNSNTAARKKITIHLQNNIKTRNPFLAAVFEFVYVISALVFTRPLLTQFKKHKDDVSQKFIFYMENLTLNLFQTE